MNTKGNQRFIETKQTIEDVFQELLKEKTADKITVSEICRRAGIHRTTFYGHFDDVNDLMQKMTKDMYRQMMEHFIVDERLWLDDGFLNLFKMIRENKSFFKGYLESRSLQNLTFNVFPERLRKNMDYVQNGMGFDTEAELYYHQMFFSEGLKAVIRLWIARDCKESPEEMCRFIDKEYSPNKAFFSNNQDEKS